MNSRIRTVWLKRLALTCLCLEPLFLTGCVQVHYQRREMPKGEAVVTMTAWSLFADNRLENLSIDKVTKTTSAGLTLGSVDSEVSTEALNGVTESIVTGVVKGIVGKP